jgi:hypothetical protein
MSRRAETVGTPFRRPGFIAATAFIAMVVIGGGSVLLSRGGSTVPLPQQTALPTAAAIQRPQGGCDPTDVDQIVPTQKPADVTWSLYKSIALPSSPSAGPMIVEPSGVARCYAHTPLGALIALDQISTRASFASDWRRVVSEQVMPGPGRDAFVRNRAKATLDGTETGFGQIVAIRFVVYSPQLAVIQEVSRGADGSAGVYTLTVAWDGDWKLQPQEDGSVSTPGQDVASLDGFMPWSGV